MKLRTWILPAAFVGLALAHAPARADFAIVLGNVPQIDENVLLTSGQTGNTITGTTNNTGFGVRITSAAQVLESPSSGQARVQALAGNLLGIDSINLVGGATFTSLIFNLFNGSGTTAITINGFDANGNPETLTGSFSLGNGQNFFTITAVNGERITNVSFKSPGGIADVRQIRIGGAATAVPEPASATLIGVGGLGLLVVTRRRKKA